MNFTNSTDQQLLYTCTFILQLKLISHPVLFLENGEEEKRRRRGGGGEGKGREGKREVGRWEDGEMRGRG